MEPFFESVAIFFSGKWQLFPAYLKDMVNLTIVNSLQSNSLFRKHISLSVIHILLLNNLPPLA